MPDLSAMQREFDPAFGDEKLRDALAKAEPEGAAAEAKAKEGAGATAERQERPSPYEVPLSARGPASSAKSAPRRGPVKIRGGARWKLPTWLVYVMALVAVLGPAVMVMVLMRRPPSAGEPAPARAAESRAESASGPARDLEAPSVSAAHKPAVEGVRADAGVDAAGAQAAVALEPSLGGSEKKPESSRAPVRLPKKAVGLPAKVGPAPEPPPKTAPPKGEDDDVMR